MTILTKEIAEKLTHRQELYHVSKLSSGGTMVRCRVNGKCNVWKTRPSEFRLPVKHGLRDCFYITNLNCGEWQIVAEVKEVTL